MPLAVIEALAKGVPTIATSVGATVDQIDESCGVLLPAPAGDEAACIARLAKTLAQLDTDRDVLRVMSAAARARAHMLFRAESALAQYARVLGDVQRDEPISHAHDAFENLVAGSRLAFSNPAQIWNYLGDGWSFGEHDGMWTEGRSSSIDLAFATDALRRARVSFQVSPLIGIDLPVQESDLYANGTFVESWHISQARQVVGIELDLDHLGATVVLTLVHRCSRTPADLGLNQDTRELALLFHTMTVDDASA